MLNVAGPRAPKEPDVYGFVKEVHTEALAASPISIVFGNQEQDVNEMYQMPIRLAHPDIIFRFLTASYVGEFIELDSRLDTRVAFFSSVGRTPLG